MNITYITKDKEIVGELTISGNSTATTLTTQNQWYQITAGWSVGDVNKGIIASISGSLTGNCRPDSIVTSFDSAINVGHAGATYQIAIFKNGLLLTEHLAQYKVTNPSDDVNIGSAGVDTIKSGDVFTLYARCTSRAATSITVLRANLSLWSI